MRVTKRGNLENSAVTLTAGGRRNWYYDPEHVVMEHTGIKTRPTVNKNILILKGSAGGWERGLSMQWELTEDFLLESLARMSGVSGSEVQIINGVIGLLQERKEKIIYQQLFNVPLSKTEIKKKTMQVLAANGLDFIGDIVTRTRGDLESLPNVGGKTIEEIESMLSTYGMSTRQEADDF